MTIEAAHDGYRHLRGRPRAPPPLDAARAPGCRSIDTVTGGGRHARRGPLAPGAWHAASGCVPAAPSVATAAGEFAVTVDGVRAPLAGWRVEVARPGGHRLPAHRRAAPVLTCRLDAELPVRITTAWRRAAMPPEPDRRPT